MKSLTSEFKRAAAFTLLAALPLGLAGCHRDDKQAGGNGADADIVDLCLAGCPEGAPASNIVLRHRPFTLSYDLRTKFGDWVAYKITPQSIGCDDRPRHWLTDPDLPPGVALTARPDAYKGAEKALHADRGHQAPLAALGCLDGWEDLNDLSNITPQASHLNRGVWDGLEKRESKLVTDGGAAEVYGITGLLYERPENPLPNANLEHVVPSGYFKIDVVRAKNEIDTAAFIYDQETPRGEKTCDGAVTIGEVEKRTHLKFFPALPQSAREKLENTRGDLLPKLGCS